MYIYFEKNVLNKYYADGIHGSEGTLSCRSEAWRQPVVARLAGRGVRSGSEVGGIK